MCFGLVEDKTGNLGFWVAGGGWVRWRRAGGGVSVVGEVDAGGGWRWFEVMSGVWMLGRGELAMGVYGWEKKMGERGRNDLKIGPEKVPARVRLNVHKYIRPHLCLVRWVKKALRSNVKVDV
jgi:hypothetical protein